MTVLRVLACGPATTIQDGGRRGWARLGIAPAGAMDIRALRSANALVGNSPGAAAVEFAFVGGRLRAEGGAARVAVCGAEALLQLDGAPVAMHTSFVVEDGQTLSVGRTERGVYVMLAVEGGFALAPALGSMSCDRRAGLAGLAGRPLAGGDLLPLAQCAPSVRQDYAIAAVDMAPNQAIRVVIGPQHDYFGRHGVERLLSAAFEVSHHIDRMAYKLEGAGITRVRHDDMISDATLPGSVQIPPDGAPLVLMADRQTIGGYPKIATVVSCDLGVLAQRWPGAPVRFEAVTAAAAQDLARAEQRSTAEMLPLLDGYVHSGMRISDSARNQPVPALGADALARISDCTVDALDPRRWDPARIQAEA